MLSYGHLVYDFGTVKNRGTEKKNRTAPEPKVEPKVEPSHPYSLPHLIEPAAAAKKVEAVEAASQKLVIEVAQVD